MTYDPSSELPPEAQDLVSFARARRHLFQLRESLDPGLQGDQREGLLAEFELVMAFLAMFPPHFYSPVPYPGNQPGRFVYGVSGPPRPWP